MLANFDSVAFPVTAASPAELTDDNDCAVPLPGASEQSGETENVADSARALGPGHGPVLTAGSKLAWLPAHQHSRLPSVASGASVAWDASKSTQGW